MDGNEQLRRKECLRTAWLMGQRFVLVQGCTSWSFEIEHARFERKSVPNWSFNGRVDNPDPLPVPGPAILHPYSISIDIEPHAGRSCVIPFSAYLSLSDWKDLIEQMRQPLFKPEELL